ncbi:TetR/AcrR family transcriptional regulator C-terminal domain-containing protein [Paenibacillus sepulcri]|uniref:TetR/AcrR family transcriptional regulator C-terminal domain-containing protein n=1 Tax=Paenibacillus sepulcri TaxID=359917 RepID=A0ABS7BX94_9BACL|nr:TetR/AcrR family transcriptional regulator C-terminal domain-containing protein [Paenibacillus sepulcri]
MARRRIYPQNLASGSEGQEITHIPLDQARITQTALLLLNEIGLKELSMRKIADKLQVKTASLYYHVKDKDQLLQLLADKISEQMVWPDADLPWTDQILQWGEQFRRALHAYRDAVDIFNTTIAMGYHRLLQIEKLYKLLASAGFPDHQIPWAASMLKNHVLGFVAEEARLREFAGEDGDTQEKMSGNFNQFYSQLPEDQFPYMIRLASYTTNSNWDEEFQFGLSVFIAGFSLKLPPAES